jgi:hypothetical protein
VLITRKYMKEKGSCLDAWCSVFNRLKSGFSRVDSGPLLIHDSWPPIAWAWILPPDSGCFQLITIRLTNPCFEINDLKSMI